MHPGRSSSRTRYRDYLQRRRSTPPDATVTTRATPGKRSIKRSRSFFRLFARFWSLLRGHHATVLASLATLSLSAGFSLLVPASTKFTLDYVLTDHPGPGGIPPRLKELFHLPDSREHLLWWVGIAMVAASLLAVLVGMFGRFQMTRLTKRVQVRLRRIAFDRAVRLPLHRVHFYKSGGMASLLRDDTTQAGELLFNMIYNPWRAIVQLLGTLAILAWVDWRMLVGALALLPLVWLSHRTWISRIRPVYRDIKSVRQGMDAGTTEVFGGMRVVRGFGRARAESARFTREQDYMARLEILVWWWSRVVDIAWSILIPAASAGVLIYGGISVLRGSLTIGDVMMFSTYLLMLLGPLETLTHAATSIQTNLAGLDRVLDLLEEPEEFAGAAGGRPLREVSRATARGRVELERVTFAYPRQAPGAPETEPVIRDVTLAVEPGQTIALVGPSGSGKTTLCNLIARFFDPTSGIVRFDGVDLREIHVASYRRLLGIVEQDVFLFDGTIAENISYGNARATREQVEHAARAANAHEFIAAFDQGYDTIVGERGVRLSGGQKQRVAIARALLADPLLLILDEATSNLDAESEALIQAGLQRLRRGRTCFVIAHRLSTVRHADRIVVMDAGRVVETGRHEDLLVAGGRYADLLRLQLQEHHPPEPANGPGGTIDPVSQGATTP